VRRAPFFHLTVTRQPATEVRLLFSVTIDTEVHEKMCPFDPVHGLHRAVTLLTQDLFPDVPLVIEEDVL
jgi:hypothetical protein